MNASDISLLVLAAVPFLYRGWAGMRYGASVEIRQALMFLFGTLVAIRYWQPCVEKVSGSVTFDPRWVALGVFVVLFTLGCLVAGLVVQVKGKAFQSVKSNYFDNVLGLVAGLFSGSLLGVCLLWLATVAAPGKFDSATVAHRVIDWPRDVFQCIETRVGVAPDSAARTRYPVVTLVPVPVNPAAGATPEGDVLMQMRGEIAWQ